MAIEQGALNWVKWLITEGMDDADEQQTYIVRNELRLVAFSRFQLWFTKTAVKELKTLAQSLNLNTTAIDESIDLLDLELDAIHHFNFLNQVGIVFGEWLRRNDPGKTGSRFLVTQGLIELGNPIQDNPSKFHIDPYSAEVKAELLNENA